MNNTKNSLLTHKRIKQDNQKKILEIIQRNDGISRADIAKMLNLSKPAVSSNIAELLTTNIIYEEKIRGKRAVMLKYNSDFCAYIGIIIKPTRLNIIHFDLKGKVVFDNLVKLDIRKKKPEQIVSIIEEYIKSDMESLALKNIICMIISFPGIVSNDKILVSNSLPLFNNFDICSYFRELLNCEILLINDMNVKVTGMHNMFSNFYYNNILYLSHEVNGIGAGLYINGEIYEGSHKSAGEVGLIYNINKQYPTDKFKDSLASYEEMFFNIINVKDIDNLDELSKCYTSDEKIIEILAQYYSVMINNLSAIMDPDVVILGGLLYKLGDNFLNKLKKYIDQISIITIKLIISNFDNDAAIKGLQAIASSYINKNIIDIIYSIKMNHQ